MPRISSSKCGNDWTLTQELGLSPGSAIPAASATDSGLAHYLRSVIQGGSSNTASAQAIIAANDQWLSQLT